MDKNKVEVYHTNFSDHFKNINTFLNILSVDEIEKSNKYRFQIDRKKSIVSRGILRNLLGKLLKENAKHIKFNYGPYGKPDYSHKANIKFNVSHSNDMLVIAFAKDFEIGVDIENIKSNFDVMDIASNFFSKIEINALEEIPPLKQVDAFYRCWTRKESFIKAKAQGLSFPLDAFSVSIDDATKVKLLETQWDIHERDQWSLFSFRPQYKYVGAISIHGKINAFNLIKY